MPYHVKKPTQIDYKDFHDGFALKLTRSKHREKAPTLTTGIISHEKDFV